jgi:hypothetical protein
MDCFSQNKTKDRLVMKRFLLEQSFTDSVNIPMNEKGCRIVQDVISNKFCHPHNMD